MAAMLARREHGGGKASGSFSHGERCHIGNRYLPNEMSVLARYPGKAFCGTYSPDGNYFISACQDRHIRVFRTEESNYGLINTVTARDVGWSVIDVAFSPDNSCFVYSSWSTALHLCPLTGLSDQQEALSLSPTERRFCIFSIVFSSDGTDILGGANDGYLYVYDRARGRRSLRIHAHDYDVNTIAFADTTSQILYSGGDDGLAKVWDRRTLSEANPKPVGILAGHMDGITFIDSRGDGRHLISNSKDQSIKLWDVRRFSQQDGQTNTLKAVHDQTWDYRWQAVPRRLYNPRQKLAGDTSVMTYRGHSVLKTLVRCRFSPAATTGQRYIYTGCGVGRVVIYDALTGRIKRDLSGHHACVRDVSWHPHRHEIISSSWDGIVGRWRYESRGDPWPDLPSDNFNFDDTIFSDDDVDSSSNRRPKILRRSRRIAQRLAREQQQREAGGTSNDR